MFCGVSPTITGAVSTRTIIALCLALSPLSVAATAATTPNKVLHFDATQIPADKFHFKDEEQIHAKGSDFVLLDYALMSNGLGERWALVTVKNTSGDVRVLRDEHIIATFADGTKHFAVDLNNQVFGGMTQSLAIFFGQSDFPILRLEMH